MRLDRFVCKSTEFTKAQTCQLIEAGDVLVNGVAVIKPEAQVHEDNCITLHDKQLTLRSFRYIMLHKPANSLCSSIDEKYPSVLNLLTINKKSELHVAGRLDADTTGLVLITDDGRWTFDIINPEKACKKTYRVQLHRPISSDAIELFAQGLQLQGESKLTLPSELKIISEYETLLTIIEGKYHQVKRMFAAIGNKVVALHREKVGDLSLDISEGQWRHLTPDEVKSFQNTPQNGKE